jgi:hypothetical protein
MPEASPSAAFKIELIEFTQHWSPPPTLEGRASGRAWPPPAEAEPNRAAMAAITAAAEAHGFRTSRQTKSEKKKKPAREGPGKVHHYGGMPGTEWIDWQTLTIIGGSVAGIALFVKTTLEAILAWRKLREGRSIKVKFRDVEIEVKDEESAKRLLDHLQRSAGSADDSG